MRIALTGATGFAGGPILAELLRAGHEVSILVRKLQDHQFDGGIKVVGGDLDNVDALNKFADGAEVIVHVAGAITAASEAGYFQINYNGTKNVHAAAVAAGVRRLVHISSLAARIPELSPYAASKRAAEDFLQYQDGKMAILILRPSAIYGPGDKATLPLLLALQKPVAAIPGKSGARFSLLHVNDFAAVVAQAAAATQQGLLEVDDMQGGHDWAELATLNREQSGRPRKLIYLPQGLVNAVALAAEWRVLLTGRPGMVNRGKVRELYHPDWVTRGAGWPRPNAIPLRDGFAETLSWYRNEGWLPPLAQNVRSTP